MRILIVPTDFTAISVNAVNYAADFAHAVSLNLVLLHVCNLPIGYSDVPSPVDDMADLMALAEEKMGLLKEKIVLRTNDQVSVSVVIKTGDLLQQIKAYCRNVDPFAVVMGSETRNVFERAFLDGETVSAIRELSCPVIVIPPTTRFKGIRKIGLACDLQNVIEIMPFTEIKSIISEFYAELHIINVVNDVLGTGSVERSAWLQEIFSECHPFYHFIRSNDIEKSMLEFAEKHSLDVLLIIPQKHPFLKTLFRSSISKKMALHSTLPFISVHE